MQKKKRIGRFAHLLRIGVVAFASAVVGAPQFSAAKAEDYSVTLVGGVDSVSVFRGQRSRELNPSPFAVLEISYDDLLGGVVMTPAKIAGEVSPLAIGYLDYRPRIGDYRVIVGSRYYSFIASSDIEFDIDNDGVIDKSARKGFSEGVVGLRRYFKQGEATAQIFYAPFGFGDTGDALYAILSGKVFLGGDWSMRGHVGVSEFNDLRFNEDYWDYAVGLYTSALGFDVFLRYSDAVSLSGLNNRVVVFGFERALSVASSDPDEALRSRKIYNDLIIDKAFLARSGLNR